MAKKNDGTPPPSPADDDARKAKAKKKGLLFAILAMPDPHRLLRHPAVVVQPPHRGS